MRTQAEEADNQPFLTLEQWKRHTGGEDITTEIPLNRRADERLKEIERIQSFALTQNAGDIMKCEPANTTDIERAKNTRRTELAMPHPPMEKYPLQVH